MQLIKLAAASLGVHAGIRFPGKRARARSGASSEGGQASVEFALLLVLVLFPFFVGVITVGIVVNQISGADGCRGHRRAAACD